MTNDPTIEVPVISSLKEGRRQFLTSWSLKTVLFCLYPHAGNATHGSGLRLNSNLASKIGDKWAESGEAPCISPLVVAIRSDAKFTPLQSAPQSGLGTLQLPLGAILDVCDGIHRVAALQKAGLPSANLAENSWPIHFVEVMDDEDLACLLQCVEKLRNGHIRISPPSVISSPEHAVWIRGVIESSSFLSLAVAQEKSSLAPRSLQLWTGSAVRRAMQSLLNTSTVNATDESMARLTKSWDMLANSIPELRDYSNGKISAFTLRESTVLPLASMIPPLAQVCARLSTIAPDIREIVLQKLSAVDWANTCGEWLMLKPAPLRKGAWTKKLLEQTGLAT